MSTAAPIGPTKDQRDRIVALLEGHPDFHTETSRRRLLAGAIGGIPGAEAVLTVPDLSGGARGAAVALVDYLAGFGRLAGRHSLSWVLERARLGVGDDWQPRYLDLIAELDRLPAPTPRPSGAPAPLVPRSPLRELLRARLFARRSIERYLDRLTLRHREFSFLGRARPLRLEDIYVGLRVAEHLPPERVPDSPPVALAQRGRTLEVPEAMRLSRRLLVLGEAGSGKSTLLKYLALAMAQRAPSLGPFARALDPSRLTDFLEDTRRALIGTNLVWQNLLVGLVTLPTWGVAVFRSSATALTLAVALVWAIAGFLLLFKVVRHAVPIGFGLSTLVLIYAWAGPTPIWRPTTWLTTLSLALLLYPYWMRLPVAVLGWLVRRRTRYPLPILITLNNLAGDGRPLESHATAALEECGLSYGQRLLEGRLRKGRCLLLLDALDEVTDRVAYERVVAEVDRLRHAYGEGNQIVLTSRVAGYEYRLGGLLTLEVQPFQPPQVRAFVRHWFADVADPAERARRADGLLAALEQSPRVNALAASPLLLALIALLYEADWRLPERRADLYDEALKLLTERWNALKPGAGPARFAGPALRCALGELARQAHLAGLRVMDRERILALLAPALGRCGIAASADVLLEATMADTGLLRRKSRTSYDFVHLTFQEFLTAESLLRRGEGRVLTERTGDPWWREVIRLYVGQSKEPAVLLESLLPTDPLLAAGCLADAADPLGGAGVDRAIADAIVGRLRVMLRQDPAQRQAAADALAEVGDWGARELLRGTLAGGDRDLALAAVLALAPGEGAGLVDAVPGGLGALLRLLHGALPGVETGLRPRLLDLVETLGHPLCHVPAGPFWMGSDTGWAAERPRHRVVLADYWIDRHPVTNGQFAAFAQESGFAGAEWRKAFAPGKEDHPVVFVSWDDARAYAEWCGKRLPTEAEWEKAARGSDGRRYPWGDRWDGTRCNVSGRGTTPVDTHSEGASPFGCLDMAGNVQEWVFDWYDPAYYNASPESAPTGPETGVSRVLRGGSWYDAPDQRARGQP
jgi:sulfatase modifying factor 1